MTANVVSLKPDPEMWPIMPCWSIGHLERERIQIEVCGPPDNDGVFDWVGVRTTVAVGAFRSEIEMTILVRDMVNFRDSLERVYRTLSGTAEFTTLENQLGLKVEVDKLGHVRVVGYVKDHVSFGNRLDFELSLDQTFLERTLAELSEVVICLQS